MNKTPSKKTSAPAPTLTGLANLWVEVFKAGTHTDSAGKTSTFTAADLDQMAANAKLASAPIVLGHPKDNAPAYGWDDEVKREGDGLYAKFKDIHPAFEAGVKTQAYRNRSLSVFKDKTHGWRIRHYGFLGAVPPAIEGLAPIEFAAAEAESFEFAAPGYSLVWGLEEAARVFRSLRDRMIEKESLEAADAALPQWRIDSMLEAATTARAEFNDPGKAVAMPALFNQPTGDDMNFTQADLDKARAEGEAQAKAEAATTLAASQAEFSKTRADLVTLQKESQTERINAQIKDWKAKGLILPADEAGMAEFMAAQEDAAELTFSKAEGGEAKKTPAQFFADFMASRKPVVKLGGSNTEPQDDVDLTTTAGIGAAAHTFMAAEAAAGRVISVAAAVQHVTTKGAGK